MQRSASWALRILVAQVVDVARRHERDPGARRELDELRVDLLLDREPGVLELDEGRVAAEDVGEPLRAPPRASFGWPCSSALQTRPGEAAGERDQALRVSGEELPVDARLVVVALEVPERGELDQVRVALVRLGEEGQVRVPLRLRLPVVARRRPRSR